MGIYSKTSLIINLILLCTLNFLDWFLTKTIIFELGLAEEGNPIALWIYNHWGIYSLLVCKVVVMAFICTFFPLGFNKRPKFVINNLLILNLIYILVVSLFMIPVL